MIYSPKVGNFSLQCTVMYHMHYACKYIFNGVLDLKYCCQFFNNFTCNFKL